MNKSKKQIFMVYSCNLINQPLYVIMATTSILKLKSFIIKKIEDNNEDIFYINRKYSINQQVKQFKLDFKKCNRNTINERLYGLKYDYVYDGEEK